MILLILGVLLVIITIYFLYESLKEKEKELFNNISEEENIQEEYWEKYYKNRDNNINSITSINNLPASNIIKLDVNNNSLVTKKIDNNINNNKINIGIEIKKCRNIKNCSELDNLPGCGYCSSTNNFAKGDENGPYDDICPKDKWSFNKKECEKKKDQEVCVNLNSCGDLVGDVASKCAFCPTSAKIVPQRFFRKALY